MFLYVHVWFNDMAQPGQVQSGLDRRGPGRPKIGDPTKNDIVVIFGMSTQFRFEWRYREVCTMNFKHFRDKSSVCTKICKHGTKMVRKWYEKVRKWNEIETKRYENAAKRYEHETNRYERARK